MINFKKELLEKLILICKNELPKKAFGIVAGKDDTAEEAYPLHTNLRPFNTSISSLFESYGEFYCDEDRGFWVSPQEQLRVMKEIEQKGLKIVSIYHSHRCLKATPSQIDIDLHYDPEILAIIVSVVDTNSPEVRAYRIEDNSFKEVKIKII